MPTDQNPTKNPAPSPTPNKDAAINKNTTTGGGCLIAGGLMLGPIVGIFIGQVSAGLIAGGVAGVVAAILWTFYDSRRQSKKNR